MDKITHEVRLARWKEVMLSPLLVCSWTMIAQEWCCRFLTVRPVSIKPNLL